MLPAGPSHGARRLGFGRCGRCTPFARQTIANKIGLRCAATGVSWLLMVSRLISHSVM
ncbi:hypothetical protein SpAn4DRAFT_1165 [Sporomusa ovata]|uniref:Uncharacterized protein n=1 Tax=Sporomusa ovata TaxID=2378 RepID=A0A0U1L6E4_9FIRM|nr:hypothetical protein SpAn4DRAFT_1165 [Sporomusa ovata]